MRIESAYIKKCSAEAGFDLCGVARARDMSEWRGRFGSWLERDMDGGLNYLRRNVDKRFSPGLLVDNALTVIVCGVVYKNDTSPGYGDYTDHNGMPLPGIASYARAEDYHAVIKSMLYELAGKLGERYGSFGFRVFSDSAPVAEKSWAAEAGLGWIGRNSLLINPQRGSFLLLGEIIAAAEADAYDPPLNTPGCGQCRKCVEACPNSAIGEWGVDLGKCISCVTTTKAGEQYAGNREGDISLHGWIYGCDICQSVCPYNQHAPLGTDSRFAPLFDPRHFGADRWLAMDEEEFRSLFGRTPLASNSSLDRLKRYVRSGRE